MHVNRELNRVDSLTPMMSITFKKIDQLKIESRLKITEYSLVKVNVMKNAKKSGYAERPETLIGI